MQSNTGVHGYVVLDFLIIVITLIIRYIITCLISCAIVTYIYIYAYYTCISQWNNRCVYQLWRSQRDLSSGLKLHQVKTTERWLPVGSQTVQWLLSKCLTCQYGQIMITRSVIWCQKAWYTFTDVTKRRNKYMTAGRGTKMTHDIKR